MLFGAFEQAPKTPASGLNEMSGKREGENSWLATMVEH
jgi:hypothetical protein